MCRTVRHFYFNYHYYDLSSLLTSSAVTRRIEFALRMTISFLVGGFLAYGTPLNNQLALQFLIPVLSMICIQETFGMTLSGVYQIIKGLTPLSIFLYVVQKIGLKYHDYLAAELLLLISSFFVAYECSQVKISIMSITLYRSF
jgi:hypothetical protein